MSKRTKDAASAARQTLRQQRAAERRRRLLFRSALAVVLMMVAGLVGYGVYVTQQPTDVKAPQQAVDENTGLAVGNGPVTVDLYVDFLCPACKAYETKANPVLERDVDQGRITLVYHPVNFLDSLTSTEYSSRAAGAAAAAADEGKLQEYAQALFERQPPEHSAGLGDAELVGIGRSVGLTSPAFARAVKRQKYRDWVSYVARTADERGVRGTPTVLVNGRQLDNSVTALKTAVDAA